MSLNFCEKNPVVAARGHHCWHVVCLGRLRKNKTRRAHVHCCWCKDTTEWDEFEQHGPHVPRKVKR